MLKTKFNTTYQHAFNHGGFDTCKHNRYVNCFSDADCKNCGWNPKVDAKRKENLRKGERNEQSESYAKRTDT